MSAISTGTATRGGGDDDDDGDGGSSSSSDDGRAVDARPYTAWNAAVVHPKSPLVNELLPYCYPTKSLETVFGHETSPASAIRGIGGSSDSGNSRDGHNGGAADDAYGAAPDAALLQDVDDELELQQIQAAELRELCTPLEVDNRCNLCAIISICLQHDRDKRWLLDYSLLCYKCNCAPRTPLSVLIVSTEFVHLLRLHFRGIDFSNIFRERIVTVFDFQMHFFINRCFEDQYDDPIAHENITINHTNVIKALLHREDHVPYTRRHRQCCRRERKKPPDLGDSYVSQIFKQFGEPTGCRFAELLFYMWSGTNVFFSTCLTNIAIEKHRRMAAAVPDRAAEIERNTGPIYLAPTPVFALKNSTTTVCLLCELMACSRADNALLQSIYQKVSSYCQNNLKIVDRIQLTLAEMLGGYESSSSRSTKLRDVSVDLAASPSRVPASPSSRSEDGTRAGSAGATRLDPHSYFVLKQAGVAGIYKHFFCDPVCAANIRCTKPDVLFSTVPADRVRELKLAVCCENTYAGEVDRRVWLYAQIFKAFQLTKRNFRAKTQLGEFLRDFCQLLENHNIPLIDPGFVVDKAAARRRNDDFPPKLREDEKAAAESLAHLDLTLRDLHGVFAAYPELEQRYLTMMKMPITGKESIALPFDFGSHRQHTCLDLSPYANDQVSKSACTVCRDGAPAPSASDAMVAFIDQPLNIMKNRKFYYGFRKDLDMLKMSAAQPEIFQIYHIISAAVPDVVPLIFSKRGTLHMRIVFEHQYLHIPCNCINQCLLVAKDMYSLSLNIIQGHVVLEVNCHRLSQVTTVRIDVITLQRKVDEMEIPNDVSEQFEQYKLLFQDELPLP